jgi:hypothetical protein
MSNTNIHQRMSRSNVSNAIWTSAWIISLALLVFAPKFLWDFNLPLTISALGLNLFTAYKMIIANKKLLDAMDELQRKIHLNAMAITLGITVVFAAMYGILDDIKLLPFELDNSSILFVMGPTYLLCVIVGTKRYS